MRDEICNLDTVISLKRTKDKHKKSIDFFLKTKRREAELLIVISIHNTWSLE